MSIVNMHEAKTHLSQLVQRVEDGEEIVIGRAGRPVAKLVPYDGPQQGDRPLGQWKGKIWIAPDFDELPEEIAAAFRGERP